MELEKRKSNPTDYLANERTFLAWVRTSIGIMAFGFVVVKFSLFVKQISIMLMHSQAPTAIPVHQGQQSADIGIVLVVLGMFVMLMSYIRYRITNKQLDKGFYEHSSLYITVLTAVLFLISMLLVYYLIKTA